jgi:hypothetical protein
VDLAGVPEAAAVASGRESATRPLLLTSGGRVLLVAHAALPAPGARRARRARRRRVAGA